MLGKSRRVARPIPKNLTPGRGRLLKASPPDRLLIDVIAIEVEQDDDDGYHAVVIDLADDAVLHVSNTFAAPEDAERAARRWIHENG
jgi:hypothetical protein